MNEEYFLIQILYAYSIVLNGVFDDSRVGGITHLKFTSKKINLEKEHPIEASWDKIEFLKDFIWELTQLIEKNIERKIEV